MMRAGDEVRFDWRRGGAAAAGLVAALVLVVMVFLVAFANDARERALSAGIPVFAGIEDALRALGHLYRYGQFRGRMIRQDEQD